MQCTNHAVTTINLIAMQPAFLWVTSVMDPTYMKMEGVKHLMLHFCCIVVHLDMDNWTTSEILIGLNCLWLHDVDVVFPSGSTLHSLTLGGDLVLHMILTYWSMVGGLELSNNYFLCLHCYYSIVGQPAILSLTLTVVRTNGHYAWSMSFPASCSHFVFQSTLFCTSHAQTVEMLKRSGKNNIGSY